MVESYLVLLVVIYVIGYGWWEVRRWLGRELWWNHVVTISHQWGEDDFDPWYEDFKEGSEWLTR